MYIFRRFEILAILRRYDYHDFSHNDMGWLITSWRLEEMIITIDLQKQNPLLCLTYCIQPFRNTKTFSSKRLPVGNETDLRKDA